MSVVQRDYGKRPATVPPKSVWLIVDVNDPFGHISNNEALEELRTGLDEAIEEWMTKHENLNRTPRPHIGHRSGIADTEKLHVMKQL